MLRKGYYVLCFAVLWWNYLSQVIRCHRLFLMNLISIKKLCLFFASGSIRFEYSRTWKHLAGFRLIFITLFQLNLLIFCWFWLWGSIRSSAQEIYGASQVLIGSWLSIKYVVLSIIAEEDYGVLICAWSIPFMHIADLQYKLLYIGWPPRVTPYLGPQNFALLVDEILVFVHCQYQIYIIKLRRGDLILI